MFNRRFSGSVACFALLLGLAVLIFSHGRMQPPRRSLAEGSSGPKVVVSFAPLYCFAVNVAGDDAVVQSIMTTSGPHQFNPTDKDARLLQRADLFFINGLGLEGDKPETLPRAAATRSSRRSILARAFPASELLEGSCHHDHGDGAAHEHEQGPARLAQSRLRDPPGPGHSRRPQGSRSGPCRRLRPAGRGLRQEAAAVKGRWPRAVQTQDRSQHRHLPRLDDLLCQDI